MLLIHAAVVSLLKSKKAIESVSFDTKLVILGPAFIFVILQLSHWSSLDTVICILYLADGTWSAINSPHLQSRPSLLLELRSRAP